LGPLAPYDLFAQPPAWVPASNIHDNTLHRELIYSENLDLIVNVGLFNPFGDRYIAGFDGEEWVTLEDDINGGIRSFVDFDEAFIFGVTQSKYGESPNSTDIGIPVKNNNVNGARYQENLGGSVFTSDAYITKLCFDGIALTYDHDYIFEDDRQALMVSPNPVRRNSNKLFLSIEGFEGVGTLTLYNVKGKEVASRIQYLSSIRQEVGLPISSLSSGIYLLQFTNGIKTYETKILISE
jgi:hypothetical protein